jgi:hypothetical protein
MSRTASPRLRPQRRDDLLGELLDEVVIVPVSR